MTYDEFVEKITEKLNALQKEGKLKRYSRTTEDGGYTEIIISVSPEGKSIKICLGAELSFLRIDDFYADDIRIVYDDEERPAVLEDLIDTVTRILSNSYYEKIYTRNGKTLDRELYFLDDNKSLGVPMRGKISVLSKILKKLPGTKESILRP